MKNCLMIGCLSVMLLLTGCGLRTPRDDTAATPAVPEKTETPAMTAPSAPPVNTTQPENAVPPAAELVIDEIVQEEKELPLQETESPAPAAETPPTQSSGQNPQTAAGLFTGVMGTEFVVPDGFVQLYETPNIGYQYTFRHPEYEIRIEVSEIAPGYLPEDAWKTDYDNAKNDPSVTYFKEGEGWFVQSGYQMNGEEIFYAKESSKDGALKSFRITYPTAKREFGDAVTAEFEKNCRF